jgi:hypothetical protein
MSNLGRILMIGMLAGTCFAGAPAHGVNVRGCVVKEGLLTASRTAGLPIVRRLVKVTDENGAYRCTMEVDGYALKDVLERLDVKKKTDDGFDRPLDTYITVQGRAGHPVLLSYSEVFFAGDGGPILVEKARLVLPHHHEPLPLGKANPTVFMDPAKRDALDLTSCAACHQSGKRPLAVPKGWLLVVPQDGYGARFVEDIAEIAVKQVGIPVKADREASKSAVIEAPELIGLDGSKQALARELFERSTQHSWRDAAFGMGTGFHEIRHWEGADLGDLLRPLLPAGTDPRSVWVLVTAADGYRVLYSGGEVFTAPEGRGVALVDRINGAPMGPGSGRYHAVPRADFYVDRDVRMVKEVRIGLVN